VLFNILCFITLNVRNNFRLVYCTLRFCRVRESKRREEGKEDGRKRYKESERDRERERERVRPALSKYICMLGIEGKSMLHEQKNLRKNYYSKLDWLDLYSL
jgi:hypothetical protein